MNNRGGLYDLASRFVKFLGVGFLGMIVDAVIYLAVYVALIPNFALARIAASICAITFTWQLNRNFTFRDRKVNRRMHREYKLYLIASCAGAVSNLVVMILVAPIDPLPYQLISYAAGAAVGLVVNFALYNGVVFRAALRNSALF